MFHVGQKIQCIRTEEMISAIGLTVRVFSTRLVVGTVYEIMDIQKADIAELPLSLVLVELPPQLRTGDNTPTGFPATWFRPVVDRKTDISVFESMLTKQPVEA